MRLLTTTLLLLFTATVFAQLPPQTVVFKVRKAQKPLSITTVIEKEEVAFAIVEEQAIFQGGDINTFNRWVMQNIQYPPECADKGIQGRVIVQFAVNSKGNVCDVKVVRGVHPDIDKEALRIITSSPKWGSARQGGKPVKQLFTLPIMFKMN